MSELMYGLPLGIWDHTQVHTPRLNAIRTGRYLIYLPRRDRKLSWPRWPRLHNEMVYPATDCHLYNYSILTRQCMAGSRTCSLLITSPTSCIQPLHYRATQGLNPLRSTRQIYSRVVDESLVQDAMLSQGEPRDAAISFDTTALCMWLLWHSMGFLYRPRLHQQPFKCWNCTTQYADFHSRDAKSRR